MWNVNGTAKGFPDGTGLPGDDYAADLVRQNADRAVEEDRLTWRHILCAKQQTALAVTDLRRLRRALVEVVEAAEDWIADIDRRLVEESRSDG